MPSWRRRVEDRLSRREGEGAASGSEPPPGADAPPVTIMEAPGASPRALLTCLVFLLLCRRQGGGSLALEVLQTQGPLKVTAGEQLTLNCTLSGSGPPGGVRWYKGSDQGQPPIYSDKGASASHVTRVVLGSNTDYSILFDSIQPKDAGIYYCVKYMAGSPETAFKQGKGTEVSVIARPSPPSIGGPASRVDSGTPVTFNCTSEEFFPRDITLTWLKNGRSIPATETLILPPGESTSYSIESTVQVFLMDTDVKSELTCQIEHSTLGGPLRQSFKLGDALQVAPTVSVEPSQHVDAAVNSVVIITCCAKGFYPNDTILVWRENGSEIDLGMAESVTQNQDGTFSMKSFLEVNATEQRNYSTFACHVVRNSQSSDHINVTLRLHQDGKGGLHSETEGDFFTTNATLSYIVVVICVLVFVLAAAVFYFVWAKQRKGKGSTSVRLNESEKISGSTNQEPDPNNLTYADLNFDNPPKKSPRQVIEVSQKSEYASIQAAQPATAEDNVTYADLDMVHLSKAPKRPAPKPEEAGSEYASVQVQNQ